MKPVTILDVALARGVKPRKDGSINCGAIEKVGLPFFGGCQICGASIAAFNAHPSKSGYLRCSGCIGDHGFRTVKGFEAWSAYVDAEETGGRD